MTADAVAAEVPRGGDKSVGGGTATIPNEVFNLVKSIVGAGVLSLPAGIAAFGSAPSAVIPATALIAITGLISAYTFGLIGRTCADTGTDSYADAWDKTVGSKFSPVIAFSCFFDCFAGNLSYSMILADTFVSLMRGAGIASVTRNQALLGITGVVLLPLCLLKNLAALAPFSLVGIAGTLYMTLAMGFRYFGGGYAAGGKFLEAGGLLASPLFGKAGALSALSPKALILTSMLSNAYIAHFNAPKFYAELKNNTLPRFYQVIGWSFGTSVFLYSIITALGFLTFGAASNGFILNNYSNTDLLMNLSRIAVAISITCSYPLIFTGTRDGLFDLLKVKDRTPGTINKFTYVTLAVVTLLASKLTDLGLVASVGGATFGTALVFIYPAIMFLKNNNTVKSKSETLVAKILAVLGVLLSVLGTTMALKGVV